MNNDFSANRREVLLALSAGFLSATGDDAAPPPSEIPYRTLGHTDEKVSWIGMGGFHLGKKEISEADAIKLVHAGVRRGINFLDNSWDYNEGESEKRIGKTVKEAHLRNHVFLMTKNDGRSKEEFNKQLDQSLSRLQIDHLDLVQFHEIIRFEDPR